MIGQKAQIGVVDSAKAPWQEVPERLIDRDHHPRRSSIYECIQNERSQQQVMNEVQVPLYIGEKILCLDFARYIEPTIIDEIKGSCITSVMISLPFYVTS